MELEKVEKINELLHDAKKNPHYVTDSYDMVLNDQNMKREAAILMMETAPKGKMGGETPIAQRKYYAKQQLELRGHYKSEKLRGRSDVMMMAVGLNGKPNGCTMDPKVAEQKYDMEVCTIGGKFFIVYFSKESKLPINKASSKHIGEEVRGVAYFAMVCTDDLDKDKVYFKDLTKREFCELLK